MNTKRNRSGFDLYSIRTVTILSFLWFAAFLIVTIWSLQTFFINNYYEDMKARETQNSAMMLQTTYESGNTNLANLALSISVDTGTFVRMDIGEEIYVFDGGTIVEPSEATYSYEIGKAREKLVASGQKSLSLMANDSKTKARRLVYVSYLGKRRYGNFLYIVAPLYPVQSTISILRQQLTYISAIAFIIALLLARLISSRLTNPIKGITESAIKLGQGKYNVKFNGGGFTETNELARTLNTASYEMQKTEHYQRDLIANVSHDLKTPLTMIKSYAEMINDISGDIPEKRAQHLNVIITEADRLNKLVNDMLAASRLQSNQVELNKEKFDIVEAALEVAETYLVLNDTDGYFINFTRCKPAYVYGDKEKMKQVMSNLISNAVKYCGEDKFVNIELTRIGNKKVRFDVFDHGEGIAADELAHVWERYYRASANHNRAIEGTGLGLSIVRSILALHNANYGVDSKVGQGSDFWFEMDIVKK